MAYEERGRGSSLMPVPTESALVCYPSQMPCLLSCVLLMVRGRASSHLSQVSRGREAFFLTHATTWPEDGD